MTDWRWPVRLLGGLACAIAVYWIVAAAAMFSPVNRTFAQTPGGVEIFLSSNGIHVDVAVPVSNGLKDWHSEALVTRSDTRYLAFGWGEREFYLLTRDWSDFRIGAGLRALMWRPALMHVTEWPAPRADAIRLTISESQYLRLVRNIRAGFAPGPVRRLTGTGYGPFDNFYEGSGTYSIFTTCNQWTNRTLADAGIGAVVWSPLPQGITRR